MPFSNLFTPVSLSGIAQKLGFEAPAPKGFEALAPHGLIGGWTQTEKFNSNVDKRLADALAKAAEQFSAEHPGYTVEAYSGFRPGDKRQHGKHRAIDVRIKDPSGATVPNYQSAQSFRTYESLAQNFKSVIDQDYPDLADKARWGGYFGGPAGKYGAADLMHFDLGGLSGLGMAGGSWATGLTKAQRGLFPGAVSIGMGTSMAGVPTPTARPASSSDLANAASLNSLQDRREFERPTFAAPLGRVERSPLADEPSVNSLPPDRPMPTGLPSYTSLPPDRQMPSGPIMPSLSAAPVSLPPDRMMPSGPERPSIAPAIAPGRTIGTPPDMLSPNLISPVPGTPPSSVISPTPPEVATPTGTFPATPAPPSAWDNFKYSAKPVVKDALLGMKFAGLPGAAIGAGFGLMGGLDGLGLSMGPGFDGAVPSRDRFSTGTGLAGIMGAMGGPRGAQGFSRSNPGMSFTSLGNGMGLRRSDKFGWTEVVGPSGEVRGIRYDNPDEKGLLGKISKSMNDKFGGGISKAERASFAGKAGLW